MNRYKVNISLNEIVSKLNVSKFNHTLYINNNNKHRQVTNLKKSFIMDDKEDESKPSTSGINLKEEQTSNSESDEFDSDYDDVKTEIVADKLPDNYQNELENDLTKLKLLKKRKSNAGSKIPPHLKGLMGEANLRFARGEYEMCEKMCFEIVRQAPLSFEPYLTLSQIYENQHLEKSMQYLTIASHLKPYDIEQWCRLAQLNIDCSNKQQAITCYTRALRVQPNNYEIQLKRIKLLEDINDQRFAMRCQLRLLNTLTTEQSTEILQLSKDLAQKYHAENDYVKAIEVMNVPFNKIPDKITPEHVNIMLELLLLNKSYPPCLDIFVQFCNIEIEIIIEEDNKINILSYNMPADIQIDLNIKFIICLIKLEAFALLPKLLEPILMEDVEKIGDLYLDVAEALMSVNKHEEALKLLVPLIKSRNFFLAAVWLKHAECLNTCGMQEQAIKSYLTVVRMAPQHMEVRYPLADLLMQAERYEEAAQILTYDLNNYELDVGLLVKKIKLFKQIDDFEAYCKAMNLLFSRHCTLIRSPDEIEAVTFLDRVSDKVAKIKKIREVKGDNVEDVKYISVRDVTADEEIDLIRDALRYCYEKKRFDQMQKFSFQSLLVSRFKNYFEEMYFYCFYSALFNNDMFHAFHVIREMSHYYPKSVFVWNLFNMCNQKPVKKRKYVLRLHWKEIDRNILKILEANNALYACNYKIAIMYMTPFFKDPVTPSPFICLFVGIVLAQMCKQRITRKKAKLTQTVYTLFITYVNNRGKDAAHETYYNLARLYQHFGILHLATHYYKKVLEYTNPLIEKYPDILDLKKEAAFNLFLIYKECENYRYAKQIMLKYLTI